MLPAPEGQETILGAPFEAWTSAVQLATAALTHGCPRYDKVRTRRWMEAFNAFSEAVLQSQENAPEEVLVQLPQVLL